MIVCLKCNSKIFKKNKYHCGQCGQTYKIIDGIPRFILNVDDMDYDFVSYKAEIDKISNAEKNHFWFNSRRELILKYFDKFILKSDRAIEIGAGTGSIARMLSKNGYNLSIGEIHPCGVEYASENNAQNIPIYQFDIMNNPFKEHFDVVGLFDVLEHMRNDVLAIRRVRDMMVSGGHLILTVPAHMWLWCEEDTLSGHYRRYENDKLEELLLREGFAIKYSSNFFTYLIPFLYLRKFQKSKENIVINPVVNYIFKFLSMIESKILEFSSFTVGGSILIVAEKK